MINHFASLIIAMVIICPMANAQSSRPDSASKEASKEAEPDAKGILAGPEVQAGSEDAIMIRFDGGAVGRGGRGRANVPARRWFVLMRSLELSPQQESEIRPIIQSLQKSNREHEKDNGKRIRQLQKQVQKARRNKRDVPREVRQELAKLRGKGPKVDTYQKRIWEILTTAQQEQMRKSLALIRKEITRQRRKSRITDQQPASDKPAMKPTQQDKKTDGLDEQTKRRLNFLKSHQASVSL